MVSSQSALRGQGPLILSRASTHAHTLAGAHVHAGKHASVRVGLAEISLMTLGRENDASSSSHPEPLPLNSQPGNTPGTCHHPSSLRLACGSPAPPRGADSLDESHARETKGFQVFSSNAAECNLSNCLVIRADFFF